MQSPNTSMQRGSLPMTLCLATIWPGSSRPPRMLRFAMGIEQWSWLNRPCDFLAAMIPIICAPLRLLSQRAAVSLRRKKLLGRHCSSREAQRLHFGQRASRRNRTLRPGPAISQVKPGESSTSGDFLAAVATKTNKTVVHGIFGLIATIYSIAGKRLRGRRPRILKSKTAGLCEEPGRCEFMLADF